MLEQAGHQASNSSKVIGQKKSGWIATSQHGVQCRTKLLNKPGEEKAAQWKPEVLKVLNLSPIDASKAVKAAVVMVKDKSQQKNDRSKRDKRIL